MHIVLRVRRESEKKVKEGLWSDKRKRKDIRRRDYAAKDRNMQTQLKLNSRPVEKVRGRRIGQEEKWTTRAFQRETMLASRKRLRSSTAQSVGRCNKAYAGSGSYCWHACEKPQKTTERQKAQIKTARQAWTNYRYAGSFLSHISSPLYQAVELNGC